MKINEIVESITEMSIGAGGLEYETAVVNSIQQAIPHFQERVKFTNLNFATAGYSNVDIDLELLVNDKPFNIEIKQNSNAQMGSTSVRYDATTDNAEIVKPGAIDEEAQPYFLEAARSKKEPLLNLVKFLRAQEPIELHSRIPDMFPIGASTDSAWESAKKAGLLLPLNSKVRFKDAGIITKMYNLKNVFYIQIGGAGLFYLNQNPYNLPVPKFEGEIQIEFRPKRAGNTSRKLNGQVIRAARVDFAATGRFLTTIKSDLSLDKTAEAFQILAYIDDQTKS